MTSTPEVDSTAVKRINTSRYFSTFIFYEDEVSTPSNGTANGCDANACRQSDDVVELFDYVLEVDNDETLRIVFATVDLFLIASRWCCLHAALCGSGNHFRSSSPSRTETVSGACNTSLIDAIISRGATSSNSIGANGLAVSASRGEEPTNDIHSSTKVGRTKHCYPCSKHRAGSSSCGNHRDQHVARASNIDKSPSVTLVKQRDNRNECVANPQRGLGNSPVSSSFDLVNMASMTSTSTADFLPVLAVRKPAEISLGLDVRRESPDVVLGKIASCVVALLLIYVIVATFEHVVLEFTARCAAGITTDGDIWRMEGELHGVVKHQV